MLFTMHATVMIFLVIIPILAGAFGNFLIPLMIGADDMAFPDAQHAELLVHVAGVYCVSAEAFLCTGMGRQSGWTVYPPLSVNEMAAPGSGTAADTVGAWPDIRGRVVDDGIDQLHDHDHPDARTGNDDVPAAADDLGDDDHGDPASVRACRCSRPQASCSSWIARWAPASSCRKAA